MAWSESRRSGTSSDEGLQETFYTKWESPLNIKCTVKLELASILIRDDCFWECMYFITVLCEGHVFTPVCQSFCSQRGRAWWGGMCGRGCAWQGGMCGRGHAWQGGMCGKGACMAGAVCGRGGGVARGCMAGGAWQGACMPHMPPPQTLRDTVGQCAGGTHPTGMHSCIYEVHKIIKKISLDNCDNCVLNRFGKLDLCKFLQIIGDKTQRKEIQLFFAD